MFFLFLFCLLGGGGGGGGAFARGWWPGDVSRWSGPTEQHVRGIAQAVETQLDFSMELDSVQFLLILSCPRHICFMFMSFIWQCLFIYIHSVACLDYHAWYYQCPSWRFVSPGRITPVTLHFCGKTGWLWLWLSANHWVGGRALDPPVWEAMLTADYDCPQEQYQRD